MSFFPYPEGFANALIKSWNEIV